MSAGGYDTASSRYESRRSSGSIHSSYDVSVLYNSFPSLTFIFYSLSRGILYHAAGLLRQDRCVDLMIATFRNGLNYPSGIPSPFLTGRTTIDLVLLAESVARRVLSVMSLQHAIQTGSALLGRTHRFRKSSCTGPIESLSPHLLQPQALVVEASGTTRYQRDHSNLRILGSKRRPIVSRGETGKLPLRSFMQYIF